MRFIIMLGVVSLFADMTYEGARSITGPYLGVLGASAAVVGIVSGFGELVGYAIRLLSGWLGDRTQRATGHHELAVRRRWRPSHVAPHTSSRPPAHRVLVTLADRYDTLTAQAVSAGVRVTDARRRGQPTAGRALRQARRSNVRSKSLRHVLP